MRTALVVLLLAGTTARADEVRTPRQFWLGGTFGLGMGVKPSEFVEGNTLLDPLFAAGLDVGVQRISGGRGFYIDADLLPISSIYRVRAAALVGVGFDTNYRMPCIGPPGYSCTKIYRHRKVRSIVGFKFGGELGASPDGETVALEAGVAFRSQMSVDLSFLLDPRDGTPGAAMDFGWQMGPFYMGMEMRGLFSKEQALPAIFTFTLGYSPSMF